MAVSVAVAVAVAVAVVVEGSSSGKGSGSVEDSCKADGECGGKDNGNKSDGMGGNTTIN